MSNAISKFILIFLILFYFKSYGQNQVKSYILLDSLSIEKTFVNVESENRLSEKIYLFNIRYNDAKYGTIYLVFNILPALKAGNRHWDILDNSEIDALKMVGLDYIKSEVSKKINHYILHPSDCNSSFYIDDIALIKSNNNSFEIATNFYVEFFTCNPNSNATGNDFINLNYNINTYVIDSLDIKGFKINNFRTNLDAIGKLYLIKKTTKNLFIFNRDIFCFFDYEINPNDIKGEILKRNDAIIFFNKKYGVVGKSLNKYMVSERFLYLPYKIKKKPPR